MKITNPTLAIAVRPDGSAAVTLHHGGTPLKMELSDAERQVVHAATAPPAGPAKAAGAASTAGMELRVRPDRIGPYA